MSEDEDGDLESFFFLGVWMRIYYLDEGRVILMFL